MNTVLPLIILGVGLCGCATSPSAVTRQQAEEVHPVCSSRPQCDAMWAAARDWARSSWCPHPIRIMNDSYIETYESIGNEVGLACWVRTDPLPQGGYQFTAHARCANWFMCMPRAVDAVLAFNAKVTAAGAPPAP